MSWDRWWQRGTGREHLLPAGPGPHFYKRIMSSIQWQKKNILKKVTLVKNKLFCQVSPSKSSSLHRTRIAAPNPLTKKSMLYPKTSGDLDLGVLVHLGVHTPAALIIVTPDFASVGVRTWGASTVLWNVAPAGAGDPSLCRHLGRKGDEVELDLVQKQARRKCYTDKDQL